MFICLISPIPRTWIICEPSDPSLQLPLHAVTDCFTLSHVSEPERIYSDLHILLSTFYLLTTSFVRFRSMIPKCSRARAESSLNPALTAGLSPLLSHSKHLCIYQESCITVTFGLKGAERSRETHRWYKTMENEGK